MPRNIEELILDSNIPYTVASYIMMVQRQLSSSFEMSDTLETSSKISITLLKIPSAKCLCTDEAKLCACMHSCDCFIACAC